jgi:hypothetical protein
MVARGDGVLVGLIGFMAFFFAFHFSGFVGLTLAGVGVGLLSAAIVLYAIAGPPSWSPSRKPGRDPWVTLACPVCKKPLGWVDEIGQWYCPACKAYLPAMTVKTALEIAR